MLKVFARQLPEYPLSLPGPPLFRVRQGLPNQRVRRRQRLPFIRALPRRLEGRLRANRLYVP